MLAAMLLAAGVLAPAPPALAVGSGCGGSPCVNIGGLAGDEFDLGSWNGAANTVRVVLRHCVFSNRPNSGTKTYDATITGVGTAGGAFLLAGPGGNLPYEVELNDNSGFVVMPAGVEDNFNALTEAAFDSCTNAAASNGGQRLRVTVYKADLETFTAGTYSGSLRIDVAAPVGNASDFETSGTISVEIPPLVRLLGLRNSFNLGNWNPDSATGKELSDNAVCIWSNHPSGQYTVTVTTGTGALEMMQAGDGLPFEVWWSGTSGINTVAGSEAQLLHGVPEIFSTPALTTGCTGGDTASMVVAASEDALAAAVSGAYTADVLVSVGVAP